MREIKRDVQIKCTKLKMAEQYAIFCVRLRFSTTGTHMVVLKRKRTQTNENRRQTDVNGSNKKQYGIKREQTEVKRSKQK